MSNHNSLEEEIVTTKKEKVVEKEKITQKEKPIQKVFSSKTPKPTISKKLLATQNKIVETKPLETVADNENKTTNEVPLISQRENELINNIVAQVKESESITPEELDALLSLIHI